MVTTLLTLVMMLLGVPPSGVAASARPLYVDGGSRGGRCADTRSVAEARSASRPWCSIDRAMAAAPDGGLVLVRGGRYPAAEIQRRTRSRRVTFRPYRDERVTLGGLTIEDSSRLRFEGFRIRGRTRILFGSGVQLVGNDIAGQGISVRPSDDLLIEDNRIHDLTYDGVSGGAGYGVWLSGGWSDPSRPQRVRNVVIRGNVFERIPADGIQMGSVRDVLIEGNRFTRITPFLDPTEHSDAIQMYGTSENVTVRRNVFHDTTRGLIAKGKVYPGLVIDNNLMARLSGTALNIYDAPGVRIVHNTIWDVPLALRFRDLPETPEAMEQAIVANNILQNFEFANSQLAVEDYNLIGQRLGTRSYGPNDLFAEPRFADRRRLDYSLRASSPAIDSGTSRFSTRSDRLGRERLDVPERRNRGTGAKPYVDRGAYEYRPTAPGRRGPRG